MNEHNEITQTRRIYIYRIVKIVCRTEIVDEWQVKSRLEKQKTINTAVTLRFFRSYFLGFDLVFARATISQETTKKSRSVYTRKLIVYPRRPGRVRNESCRFVLTQSRFSAPENEGRDRLIAIGGDRLYNIIISIASTTYFLLWTTRDAARTFEIVMKNTNNGKNKSSITARRK